MALLDQYGRKISDENPTQEQIQKGFESYRNEIQGYGLEKSSRSFKRRLRQGSQYNEFPTFMPHPTSFGRLGFSILRHLYQTSSAVRPAVDGITREISGLPWTVIWADYKWHPGSENQQIIDWLSQVNLENETINQIISEFLNDYLVVGRGIIEKVRNPFQEIIELVARDASLFRPVLTKDGTGILGYRELSEDYQNTINIYPKYDVVYKVYSPVTYTHMSLPIIETIVNEISLLLLSTKNIAWAFMNDEIPPGILHLGEIGQEALERAQASFEAARGTLQGHSKIRVVDNVDEVNWVQLQRPFREMQVAELLPIFERIVARNFGLASVEAGLTASESRGSSEIQLKSAQSKMIVPLLTMITQFMNYEILREFTQGDLIFQFTTNPTDNPVDKENSLMSQVDRGIITTNEMRISIGRPPRQGADMRTVRLGNEIIPLDDITGEPHYRNPLPENVSPSDVARQTRRDEEGGTGNVHNNPNAQEEKEDTEVEDEQQSSLILSPENRIPSFSDINDDSIKSFLNERNKVRDYFVDLFNFKEVDND